MSSFEIKRAPRWRRIRKLKLRQYGGDFIDLGRADSIITGIIHMENTQIYIDKPVSDEVKAKAVLTYPKKVMLNGDNLNEVIDDESN